jgi:hypothetical protein
MCLRTSRLKVGPSPDAAGRGQSPAGILIRRFSGPREGVACASRQSVGQRGKDISACGEKSSPSPWSSPPGEEITTADLGAAVYRIRRSIDRVRRWDWRSNEQRFPGLKARKVIARGEAQRSPGERPSIGPRPVRPEHRCIECVGLSGLRISAPPDPGPPGRAVTLQAFGPDSNSLSLKFGYNYAAPLELGNFDNFKDLELHLCRAAGAAEGKPKESNPVQANDFHRRDAETRRSCGVEEGARERGVASGAGGRSGSNLRGLAPLRDKTGIFGANRGESNQVQAIALFRGCWERGPNLHRDRGDIRDRERGRLGSRRPPAADSATRQARARGICCAFYPGNG